MQALNLQYRGVDRSTDVLSFSLLADGPDVPMFPDWPLQLGEIVLSVSTSERQAIDLGHSLDTELAWLAIHGALQLLGYAHESDEAAAHMEALEQDALRALVGESGLL
jgi:probable rRNA maturation factor